MSHIGNQNSSDYHKNKKLAKSRGSYADVVRKARKGQKSLFVFNV
jgi:hypothetical protein